ncbi:hypothetical protein Tco_0341125 [Tanacetum coccineum]
MVFDGDSSEDGVGVVVSVVVVEAAVVMMLLVDRWLARLAGVALEKEGKGDGVREARFYEGTPTTLEGVNARVIELAETHERDTQDLYAHLEDAQDSRARLSGRVDILLEDRQFHQQTVMLMEDEALVSREAWAQAMGCSAAVHYELQAYKAHIRYQIFTSVRRRH